MAGSPLKDKKKKIKRSFLKEIQNILKISSFVDKAVYSTSCSLWLKNTASSPDYKLKVTFPSLGKKNIEFMTASSQPLLKDPNEKLILQRLRRN